MLDNNHKSINKTSQNKVYIEIFKMKYPFNSFFFQKASANAK